MTKVAVVVPFDAVDPQRQRVWGWLRRRYEQLHPRWPLVIEAGGLEPWSKGAVVNAGVERTDAEILVIADADCFTVPAVLELIVRNVADPASKHQWGVPFGDVYRLDGPSTDRILERPPDCRIDGEWKPAALTRAKYPGKPGGGIVVVHRHAFVTVGGMDPRFLHWGGEDKAFGYALRCLTGRAARATVPLWHLWHPPSPAMGPRMSDPPENAALLRRYTRAQRTAGSMRALVAEHS